MNSNNESNDTPNIASNAKVICKLGLDCHAAHIVVARQLEGQRPQPAQKIPAAQFLAWVERQLQKGYKVISCYEAGPTGYWLHRKLQALGVTNYVVCPTKLDSRGKGVNTDKTDAMELLARLDRYVAGNWKSFSVVRVPTEEQEQKRALSRQREQLRRKRLSFAAQGRMLLLSQGYRWGNNWWKGVLWDKLRERVPAWLVEPLERFQRLIKFVDKEVQLLTVRIGQAAPKPLPKGMGALTHEVMEREVRDWHRFKNRRQIGSYSGLTGGVSASGESSADLSITKAGNRRLSVCLIECAWRMVWQQPSYWLVKKWAAVLRAPKVHTRRRRKAIVAFARQLLVDIWKWKTGKTTPEALGWQMV